jgi:S-formylglutathione hydrolase FrmB
MLPTSDKPEDNFVAGVDIGGYGAVKLAIAPRPARFSLAGSFNGELELAQEYVEGRFAYPGGYDIFGDAANVLGGANDLYHAAEIFKAGGRIAPKLYLSCNTKNKSYDANVRFREKLVSLGFDAAWNEEDGDGGWRSLNKQLETFMDALPL